MNITGYCRIYKIHEDLAGLLQYIDKAYWYLFTSKKVIDTGERNIILVTGYYTGTGPCCKRVSVTPIITKACIEGGYRFSAYNDAPKGGAKGEKVKIYF